MSFILDALKKSEAERQRQAGPALLEMRVITPRRTLPMWAVGLGVLLVVNLGILAWLGLRSSPRAGSTPPTANTATAPSAAPPATPAAAAPAVPLANASAAAPAAAVSGATPPLAAEAAAAQRDAQQAAPNAESDDNPADTAQAVMPPRGRPREPVTSSLPNYAALSATLPALRLDLHAWAEQPADRYALINMHRVREGDVLPEGPHVQQITREGVVLDYRGTEFLLGRE
jgi:general secretion pathway protein B